ncbi:DUF6998 domain-containing protein [Bauldia litoralis]|uniref:DUF6998 domain-containing protein n=1 Tax=Bauldia litoralis TaxID=665467 RepID=UPI0032630487
MIDLAAQRTPALLELHADVLIELRRREIVRSTNNPVGDYGEFLFAKAFGWTLNDNSSADADAVDDKGQRYQIKSRRITRANPSRQLSFMRRLPDGLFDYLAAVLFDERYRVIRAAIIPHTIVVARARRVESVNAWRLMLVDSVWDADGVVDATASLKTIERELT